MRTNQYSLAAALRVCQQCEAMSPAREWRLLDRVTIDRSAPGMQVLVRMDGIPATDSRGRIAHVRGLYVHAEADITLAAANPVYSAHQLRSIWPSTFLRDFTGWNYFSDLDARTFLDDQYFRWGSSMQWPPLQSGVQAISAIGQPIPGSLVTADAGLAVNIGVGDIVRDISFYIPFTGPTKHPLRGLIPLAALQRVSNNALTIRMGTQFGGAPAGVTFNGPQVQDVIEGTTREGFDIWADIVWLSGLVVDAPWQLDEYTLTELTGVLLNPERVSEYVWVRFFEEDKEAFAGHVLVEDLDGITLTLAGFTIKQGQRIDDAFQDMYFDEMSRWQGSINRSNAAQSLPLADANANQTALSLLPFRPRQAAAAGPVNFRYQTRGADVTFTRYQHKTVTCHTGDRGKMIQERLGMGVCGIVGTDKDGKRCKGVRSYEPVIAIPKAQSRRRRQSRGLG